MIPYYSSTQGKALEEKVENVESKADGAVKSINGKKHIPWGVGTSPGGDCLFEGYNFVLKSLYGYAEDSRNHFDDNIPVVMGNDPATVEQSFKYSVPIRDGHGRMFTYCGTQKYHAELEYEVMNLGAVKYVIKQEVAKTATLELLSTDFGEISGAGKTVTLTAEGSAKVQAFFATNSGKAVKNMTKVHLEVPNMSSLYFNMFNYVEAVAAMNVTENIQFMSISNATVPTIIIGTMANQHDSTLAQFDMNDENYITAFKGLGMKFTMTYTDIPE